MSDITLIGIDPGRAHTGACAWSIRKKEIVGNITLNMSVGDARKEQPFNPEWWRLNVFYNELVEWVEQFPNPVGIIEQYIFYGKMTQQDFEHMDRSVLELAETHGAIMAAMARCNAPCVKIMPTQMKFFVTGDGSADKRLIIKKVFELYGTALEDEHQFDALCMCHIGRYLVAFIVNSQRLRKGSYEYTVCNDILMYHKHRGFAKAVGQLISGSSS